MPAIFIRILIHHKKPGQLLPEKSIYLLRGSSVPDIPSDNSILYFILTDNCIIIYISVQKLKNSRIILSNILIFRYNGGYASENRIRISSRLSSVYLKISSWLIWYFTHFRSKHSFVGKYLFNTRRGNFTRREISSRLSDLIPYK